MTVRELFKRFPEIDKILYIPYGNNLAVGWALRCDLWFAGVMDREVRFWAKRNDYIKCVLEPRK